MFNSEQRFDNTVCTNRAVVLLMICRNRNKKQLRRSRLDDRFMSVDVVEPAQIFLLKRSVGTRPGRRLAVNLICKLAIDSKGPLSLDILKEKPGEEKLEQKKRGSTNVEKQAGMYELSLSKSCEETPD